MGARNPVWIWIGFCRTSPPGYICCRVAKLIPWNRFLASLKVWKFGLRVNISSYCLGLWRSMCDNLFRFFALHLHCYTPSVQWDWIFGFAWISDTGNLQIVLPDLFPDPFQPISYFSMIRQSFKELFKKLSRVPTFQCREFSSGVSEALTIGSLHEWESQWLCTDFFGVVFVYIEAAVWSEHFAMRI